MLSFEGQAEGRRQKEGHQHRTRFRELEQVATRPGQSQRVSFYLYVFAFIISLLYK